MNTEDEVWAILKPEDIWIYDKLILSKKLGYVCGPIGVDVPMAIEFSVQQSLGVTDSIGAWFPG